jgi:prepilin peptidase CpaA
MPSEFHAALDVLAMLVPNAASGVLMILLLAAAVGDIRTGRIPNWLVFGGALYGLLLNAFFSQHPHHTGMLFALGGMAIGLGALLPLYLLRVMGAGDVKLMAMVGVFLGPSATFAAAMATLLAGGVMAVGIALYSGRLVRMLRNVAMMSRGTMLTLATGVRGLAGLDGISAGRMPYGAAIAAGTIGYLIAAPLGSVWSAS